MSLFKKHLAITVFSIINLLFYTNLSAANIYVDKTLSSNCSEEVREDAERYCEISGTECVPLTQTNDEIGVMCRKPFSISVVGVKA